MRTKAGLYVDASETHAMLTRPEGREVVLIDVSDPVEVKFTDSTRSAPAADTLYAMGYPNVYSMVDGFEGGKANSAEPVLTR